MKVRIIASLLAGMAVLAACGPNTATRAGTGALGGAVVAGPVGAAVGGAGGALID